MAFPREIQQWWMRVAGNGNAEDAQCQMRFVDERNGLIQCRKKGEQVHHITPEALLMALGVNPNGVEGLVVCLFHHILGKGEMFENSGSFHPDMGEARQTYWQNKNSFKDAAALHREKANRGERFWNGDESTDQYYTELVKELAFKYSLEHPEDPKPNVPPHKKVMQPNHWYSIFFNEDT